MAKRIQMRKNRFLAIQKIAEQKKLGVDGGPDSGHAPKQTVSIGSSGELYIHYVKVNKKKAHRIDKRVQQALTHNYLSTYSNLD